MPFNTLSMIKWPALNICMPHSSGCYDLSSTETPSGSGVSQSYAGCRSTNGGSYSLGGQSAWLRSTIEAPRGVSTNPHPTEYIMRYRSQSIAEPRDQTLAQRIERQTMHKPNTLGRQESKVDRLFIPVKKFFRGLSPSPASGSQQSRQPSPGPASQGHSIQARRKSDEQQGTNDLWSKAYKQLPEEYKKDLAKLEKLNIIQKLFAIAKQAEKQNLTKQFKLKWGDKEIDVREKAEGFVEWLNKFKEIGDIVMQYDPGYAALPWAGVRFILMVCGPLSVPLRNI